MKSKPPQNKAVFSLDELVAEANRLLPRYLSEQVKDARLRLEVNARLVRHLVTLGVLNEALREGREARYNTTHLLQLLVARRLMSEGHSTSTIRQLFADADDVALQVLLERGAQVTAHQSTAFNLPAPNAVRDSTANPSDSAQRSSGQPNSALDFLRGVQSRASAKGSEQSPPASSPSNFSGHSPASSPAPSGRLAPASPSPLFHKASQGRAEGNVASPASHWQRYEVQSGLELHVREDFQPPPTPHEREGVLDAIESLLKNLPSSDRKRRKSL